MSADSPVYNITAITSQSKQQWIISSCIHYVTLGFFTVCHKAVQYCKAGNDPALRMSFFFIYFISSAEAVRKVGAKTGRSGTTDGGVADELLVLFTWVVNPGLNDIIQSKSTGRLFAPQPLVHGRSQDLGHVVVVFAEVGVLLLRGVLHLHLVVRVTERHGCSLWGEKRWFRGGKTAHETQTLRPISTDAAFFIIILARKVLKTADSR